MIEIIFNAHKFHCKRNNYRFRFSCDIINFNEEYECVKPHSSTTEEKTK